MTGARLVVAGAIIDPSASKVLLAQRRYPVELAGRWEFPGGKVESGEAPPAALRRELQEELGVDVVVGDALPGCVLLRGDLVLVAYCATVATGTVPKPMEHQAIRWVGPDILTRMSDVGELVGADTLWVPQLVDILRGR